MKVFNVHYHYPDMSGYYTWVDRYAVVMSESEDTVLESLQKHYEGKLDPKYESLSILTIEEATSEVVGVFSSKVTFHD